MLKSNETSQVDPSQFMVYSPVQTYNSSMIINQNPQEPAPQKKYKSIFARFFIIQDGVISVSLRDQTIILSALISISLIVMGYFSCHNNDFECDLHDFPMVSTVIALPMYDRTFIILTTIMMFGVQQVNIRAFYKKLYGIIPDKQNDNMFNLGVVSCFALPLIGVFDEHKWGTIHGICAIAFFGCFGVYCVMLGNYLSANKDKFNPAESHSIDKMKQGSRVIVVLLAALLLSFIFYHSKVPTPLIEWAVVLYYSNFFAIASYANGFYDSVHQDGTLIKP
ncbi:UNKNOWN [Stylonychia lemnae]|uniref:CWH43-like N-terminal domain-containing protein n=1 Tax=Stylonychia lemnae TaxID=5949 RepID=A0A078AMT9_STYLE|nr:UNKNOWN [Stylonychia lemnae]|eukprot:CDW83236.1 UNKNOWN [Stylonychia lemnae]